MGDSYFKNYKDLWKICGEIITKFFVQQEI